MKYLCLGYFDPKAMDLRPRAEIDLLMKQCGPHLEALYAGGQVRIDAGLAHEAKNLRRKNGKLVVTDGPFIETKELLGSAFLIEAETFEDAARVAALHPTTQIAEGEQLGWRLELRPIHYFKEM